MEVFDNGKERMEMIHFLDVYERAIKGPIMS